MRLELRLVLTMVLIAVAVLVLLGREYRACRGTLVRTLFWVECLENR